MAAAGNLQAVGQRTRSGPSGSRGQIIGSSSDVLLTLAELAIAFVGFSAVVAVFGRRASGVWSAPDRLRLMWMVQTSFAALSACLFPFLLHHLGMNSEHIWLLCSGALIAYELFASTNAYLVVRRSRVSFDGAEMSRSVAAVNYATSFVSVVVQIVNVASGASFGPYLVGIAMVMVRAGIQFSRLVFIAVRGPAA